MRTHVLAAAAVLIVPALAAGHGQRAFAAQTKAPAAPKSAVKVEVVAKGLAHPWALQFLPDGRMLITERPGRLRVVSRDGTLSPVIAGVPKVHAAGQGGLLDVALTPDFATSQEILLSFSEPREGGANGTSVAAARLELTDRGGNLANVRVIFRQQPAFASNLHFGSRIVFAEDGSFFLTVGDRYSQKQEAQQPNNHIGKVMRLNRDGTPFAGNPNLKGWDPAVWSIGHRNVQAAARHPETAELWTVEHGARGGDEVNIPRKGRNYGWPIITYGRDYSGAKIGEGTAKQGLEQPVYYWDPSIAPSGAAFYAGTLFPAWRGNLLVGGLASQALSRLVLDGESVVAEERLLVDLGARIRDVRVGPDGAVWVLTDSNDGQLLRLVPG